MKVTTIIGARPQFIKAEPVIRSLKEFGHQNYLIHTGQHYDHEMSRVFFDELQIPEPDQNLNVGSGLHGWQTGQMLIHIEDLLQGQSPDFVIVYGDTNSTLAGALAACKLGIPVAHVEAGLRSYNREMPEEYNRVLTDHSADILFCPTKTAVDILKQEGIHLGVYYVGDTMYDALLHFSIIAHEKSKIIQNLNLEPNKFLLATVHRPYNTDRQENLTDILKAFSEIGEKIIFPVHPRTLKKIKQLNGSSFQTNGSNIVMIEPVGYLDMLMLEKNAKVILTDSGGMQKEAYFFQVPCVTLRPETEWVETVDSGWNIIAGSNGKSILKSFGEILNKKRLISSFFGNGDASIKIVQILEELNTEKNYRRPENSLRTN